MDTLYVLVHHIENLSGADSATVTEREKKKQILYCEIIILFSAGGTEFLCKSLSTPRPHQADQEEDQGGEEELQPQLHGDVGVPDPPGHGDLQDPAGHRVGQQSVPGEHVPGLRYFLSGQD